MTEAKRRTARPPKALAEWSLRVCAFAMALACVAWSAREWVSAWALRKGNSALAVRAWPESPDAWEAMANAQMENLDTQGAYISVQREVAIAPDDWRGWSHLAMLQWQMGEPDAARRSMEQMASLARGYDAHWRFANLLFLSDDSGGFWREASLAMITVPVDQMESTLEQCSHLYPGDWGKLAQAVRQAAAAAPTAEQGVSLQSRLVRYLSQQQAWAPAAAAWQNLAATPVPSLSHDEVYRTAADYLQQLSTLGDERQAETVWNQALHMKLFPDWAGPSNRERVANGNFDHQPPESPLDWNFCGDCTVGVSISPIANDYRKAGTRLHNALDLEFAGNSHESAVLALQTLLLAPRTHYVLSEYSRRGDSLPETGVALAVLDGATTRARIDLLAQADLSQSEAAFSTDDGIAHYTLVLIYQRPVGQVILQGSQFITGISIAPVSSAGAESQLPNGTAQASPPERGRVEVPAVPVRQ